MKHKLYSLLLAALFGLSGMQVWAQDLTTTEIDGVTYYEIKDATDLVAFADLVNTGEFGANAVLTADIALTEIWGTPIGNSGGQYTGIFDGQGHKITGFEAESLVDGGGFFGYTSGATIRNFSIDGTLSSAAGTGSGVVGYPSNSTIFNITSTLDITVPVGGVHHVGGVVGSARGGNTISSCTFAGTMTVAAGSTDNFAGIVAYLGGDSVVYCTNYGIITFSDVACAAGGIAGYLNNTGSYVKGCLNMGKVLCDEPEGVPTYGGAIVGRLRTYDTAKLTGDCWLEGSAYGGGCDGGQDKLAATCFTTDKLPTGEICYLLNGDQTTIGWYQTLGVDEAPVLDATHGQVYMNGRLHCNGDIYDGAVFSNENAGITQDEHNIVDGFCAYCGLFDENYLTPNADGFYEIGTAKQLAWFEQKVNRGTLDANAVLTADIDFADMMPEGANPEETEIDWTPIGDWGATRGVGSAGYKGHFDGQGHTIKNLNATSKQNYFGLFGVISTGSLIENFDIYGTYYTKYQYAGSVAAYARDNFPTIRNVHSFVNINNSSAGGRQGGILGGVLTTADKTIIEGCTYSGTLDGNDAGGNGNYGGIVGYVNNNGATVADITNCLFDGNVVNLNSAPGGCTFGGFVGYSNGGVVTIKNCLSIGHVESAIWGQFFGAVKSTKSSLPNSYYMGDILNGSASTVTLTATETNTADLASGEIAWKLNEEKFLDVAWYQTLGGNNYPVLDSKEALVYQNSSDGFDCVSNDEPSSVAPFISSVIATEVDFIANVLAYKPLVTEYAEAVESWDEIEDLNDFLAAYKASFELKESILKSAAAYVSYTQACEAAANYLEENSLEGTWSDFLKTYLEETIEPGTDYPNGSYPYIMENYNLDDEALAEEIAFVNQMLENALAGGVTAGTEVTRLLANSNFADGLEGWNTEEDGAAVATGGVAEVMKIARGKGSGRFNISQTLSDMPNGIYMMQANGMFLPGDDIYSQFYAGQLYLNGTANYFMAPGEDVISADEAEDKVNCDKDSDDEYSIDGETGYVPSTFTGCSYAFSAGRYLNFVAAEVTDGSLTVGVRNLGTGMEKDDWMPFGGVRVFYLGTADEANEKLDDVLEGYAKRAEVIINFFASDDPSDFMQYPNISESLKNQLDEAIGAIGSVTTGEQKMELVNTFSTLFSEVHACRKAYIAMYAAANKLFDLLDPLYYDMEIISEDEYNAFNDMVYEAQDHFRNGDISAEEALALAERLNIFDEMLPQVDGVYQLGTVAQLKLFGMTVNNGESDAKAVLTNDIDMSNVESFTAIGTTSHPFSGEFDGQNFKISNFGQFVEEEGGEGYYTLAFSGDRQGLFGFVQNATVKNFSIDGAFTYDSGTGYGAIGWAEGSTLINIHSSLRIASVSTSHHIGGVCGDMRAGSKAYNCSFSGIIIDKHNTHDCIAGIGGYSNENCLYENCANYGTVIFSASNAYAGGICGYVNNNSFVGVLNCLNVGKVQLESGTPSYSGAFVGRLRDHSNSQFVNNYMLEGSVVNTSGENKIDANIVTEEKLASGEVCFKLNVGQEELNWFQTLGEDAYPVLDDTHKVVYQAQDGSYTNEFVNTPDGSKENPFVVKSAADLSNLLHQLVSGRMNYVVMEEDVDMSGVTDWTPLFNIPDQSNGYPFIDFDGKGHVIKNLTSKTEGAYDYCGLFGILCGNVRNLGVENADVTCAGGTGILAGYLGHSTYGQPCYVENVWVTGKLSANGYCGGMFGNVANECHIYNCYANVEVTGGSDLTGGIIGRVRALVDMVQVYAAGSINRGGGIIGGGQQDATPLGTYKHVAVWNNTTQNFGPVRENEDLRMILYYDGTNFAELQSQVVAWDPEVWSCDMQPGSYPVLAAFDPDGIKAVNAQWQMTGDQSIFNLAGQRLSKMQKGINIVNGKKILVK